MKTFRKGGIHPPQNKISADREIERMEVPMTVSLRVDQHIGKPAQPIVAVGQQVVRGECVAEASGFVSASVHTPITGTVKTVAPMITVVADDDDHVADLERIEAEDEAVAVFDFNKLSAQEIIDKVRQAGIVGLGGAAFPTHVKLSPPHPAEFLLVNGAECEPYLTCDDRLMRAQAAEIVVGALLAAKACGAKRVVIGIENNKPQAIAEMRSASAELDMVDVVTLRTKYPQGGEKQLIKALTGREVPNGGLPIDVGVVVQNVATCYAIYQAVGFNRPLIERVVTVTGPEVSSPKNILAPIGVMIKDLIDEAGGMPAGSGKLILGGPMMGRAIADGNVPSVKGTSGVLILPADESARAKVEPCVRCAKCVDACPMGLEPYLISTLSRVARYDEARDRGAMNCVECGSCNYVCPSARPILDFIRLGKQMIKKSQSNNKK